MTVIRTAMLALLLLVSAVATFAQSERVGKSTASPDAIITVSVSAQGVRFTALGSIGQMRLEVFNPSGGTLYNSDFKAGSVQDWALQDQFGQPLPDGSYQCVVTFRDVSGRVGMKQGSVLVQGGQASLKLEEGGPVSAIEPEKRLAQIADDSTTAATLLAHNGSNGQVVSTRGGLGFSSGDFFAGQEVEHMRLTSQGNLGIGVNNPQAKLDVGGLIRTSEGVVFPDGSVQTTAFVASGQSLNEHARMGRGERVRSVTEVGKLSDFENEVLLATNGTLNKIARFAADGTSLVDSAIYEATGTVGIGTTSPAALLHTKSATAHDVYLENTKDLSIFFRAGLPNTVQLTAGTVVGQSALDISLATGKGLRMTTASVYGANDVFFQLNTNTADTNAFAVIESTNLKGLALSVAEARPLIFGVNRTERMRLNANGNFGIGTTNPQAKLDVAGDIQVSGNAVISGNIAAKYQDVAEWVPARQALAAGTVVSLDATLTNAVTASTRAYDSHVAGVVSAQPGVILGEGGAGKVLVATTGRVKVKVDATRHAIKIGDLLVTSGNSGMAMKSQPISVAGRRLHRPGTIIGKALEPLSKGQGEILVLLSLQ